MTQRKYVLTIPINMLYAQSNSPNAFDLFNSGDIEMRQRPEKDPPHYKHHSRRSAVEEIDSPEDEYTDNDNDKYKAMEDPELIKRRAKLLETTREMAKRKEVARAELEARRELLHRDKEHRSPRSSQSPQTHKRKHHRSQKKRHHSPDEVINVSDGTDSRDGDHHDDDDDDNAESQRSDTDRSDDSDESSESDSDNKSNYSKSDAQSDVEVRTSPLSVGELSKSGRRHSRSRSKSRRHGRSTSHSRSSSRSSSKSPSTSRSSSRSYVHYIHTYLRP